MVLIRKDFQRRFWNDIYKFKKLKFDPFLAEKGVKLQLCTNRELWYSFERIFNGNFENDIYKFKKLKFDYQPVRNRAATQSRTKSALNNQSEDSRLLGPRTGCSTHFQPRFAGLLGFRTCYSMKFQPRSAGLLGLQTGCSTRFQPA